MPIVQHTLTVSTQANGSTNCVLRMYDQDGTEYMQTFNAPAGFDTNTKVQNTIVGLDEQLALQEYQALVGL